MVVGKTSKTGCKGTVSLPLLCRSGSSCCVTKTLKEALWGVLHDDEELSPPANSCVRELCWKQNFQPQTSLQMTAALAHDLTATS